MESLENKWIEFLEDTRNEIALNFIYRIQPILKDETFTADYKINKIIEIDNNLTDLQSKWNVADYGIILNDGLQ